MHDTCEQDQWINELCQCSVQPPNCLKHANLDQHVTCEPVKLHCLCAADASESINRQATSARRIKVGYVYRIVTVRLR